VFFAIFFKYSPFAKVSGRRTWNKRWSKFIDLKKDQPHTDNRADWWILFSGNTLYISFTFSRITYCQFKTN